MDWNTFINAIIVMMGIFGFMYGIDNKYQIYKLEKQIENIKEKLNNIKEK